MHLADISRSGLHDFETMHCMWRYLFISCHTACVLGYIFSGIYGLLCSLLIGARHNDNTTAMPFRIQEPWRELTGEEGFLESWFKNRTDGAMVWKWLHYFDVYEKHFARFRNARRINLLEFGVNAGGSIDLWRAYFGPGLRYYGVDINPECRQFEAKDSIIIVGDQTSRKSLAQIRRQLPDMDIIIDDGGHSDLMQTNTMKEMFQKLQPDGVYLCEDLGSSFHTHLTQDNKGYSMLDLTKDLIDKTQAWAFHGAAMPQTAQGYIWNPKGLPRAYPGTSVRQWPVDEFARSADNVHVYRAIVVVEKNSKAASTSGMAHGNTRVSDRGRNQDIYERHFKRFRRNDIHHHINLLEFGVTAKDIAGGSIDFWRDIIGQGLHYYGVSSDPASKTFEAEDATIFIAGAGQQENASPEHFLAQIRSQVPPLDIIIDGDDGYHSNLMRTSIFKEMFRKLQPEGVYLSEDLSSRLLLSQPQGGGYSMLDLAKDLVDKSQAWLFPVDKVTVAEGYVWDPRGLPRAYPGTSVRQWPVDEFSRTANNVHVYRGVVVVEKFPRSSQAPLSVMAGKKNIVCRSKTGCISSSAKNAKPRPLRRKKP